MCQLRLHGIVVISRSPAASAVPISSRFPISRRKKSSSAYARKNQSSNNLRNQWNCPNRICSAYRMQFHLTPSRGSIVRKIGRSVGERVAQNANFMSRPSRKSKKQSMTSKGHEYKENERERERETELQRDSSFLAQIPRRNDTVSLTLSSIAVSLALQTI